MAPQSSAACWIPYLELRKGEASEPNGRRDMWAGDGMHQTKKKGVALASHPFMEPDFPLVGISICLPERLGLSFVARQFRPAQSLLFLCLALPMALFFQAVGDFPWHVILVMLGKNAIGPEASVFKQHALGDHALSFPEEIGQQAAVAHLDRPVAVGYVELKVGVGKFLEALFSNQTSKTEALARSHRLLGDFAGAVEKDNRIAQCGQNEECCNS
jgi:hypothetical protein